jgi:hypothetical protein
MGAASARRPTPVHIGLPLGCGADCSSIVSHDAEQPRPEWTVRSEPRHRQKGPCQRLLDRVLRLLPIATDDEGSADCEISVAAYQFGVWVAVASLGVRDQLFPQTKLELALTCFRIAPQ